MRQWELYADHQAAKQAATAMLAKPEVQNVQILYSEQRRRKYRVAPGWMNLWRGEEKLAFIGAVPKTGLFVEPDW